MLPVLKGGEDGGYAVRAFEATGRGLEATLTVLGRTIEANFAPHEIKTFVLPREGGDPVETDLLES
jgi:alpha-mannosidase